MSDTIETKLSVKADAWEAGFSAAEAKLKHFDGEVASTSEKVKQRLESLKESFGRRSIVGEGFETLIGGGAIAGVGMATREIAEGAMKVYEGISHEQAKRDALVQTTKMQALAQENVRDIVKQTNDEIAKTAGFVDQSNGKIASLAIAAIADPAQRQQAGVGADYDKQAQDIRDAAERDKMAAKTNAQKQIDQERKQAQDATNAYDAQHQDDAWMQTIGIKDYNPGDAQREQADKDAAKIHRARNEQIEQIERDTTVKLVQLEKERQAKLASFAAAETAKTTFETRQSEGFRAFDTGAEAKTLRAGGADESAVKSAYELQSKQRDGLITSQVADAAIAEQLATRREAAEQGVRNALSNTKESQESLTLTMQRGAVAGGEVNHVLDLMTHHQITPAVAQGLMHQAEAADTAAQRIADLAKGYSTLRQAGLEAGQIQTLLNRGVDAKWVTQLAGMGGAAMNAAQLNSALQQLEANDALKHMVQRTVQAENSLKSLGEHLTDLREALSRGVDAKFADQIAGMGNLSGPQLNQAEQLLKKQEQVNEVINARKHIEDQAVELAAKRINMSAEEYKLRQQGDVADADTLHRQEQQGRQLDANLKLTEAAIEARNRDAAHEVRNRYSAIRPAGAKPDLDLFHSAPAGNRGNPYYHPEMISFRAPDPGRSSTAQAAGLTPTQDQYLRQIRDGIITNLGQTAQF